MNRSLSRRSGEVGCDDDADADADARGVRLGRTSANRIMLAGLGVVSLMCS